MRRIQDDFEAPEPGASEGSEQGSVARKLAREGLQRRNLGGAKCRKCHVSSMRRPVRSFCCRNQAGRFYEDRLSLMHEVGFISFILSCGWCSLSPETAI